MANEANYLHKPAIKALRLMPSANTARILAKIEQYADGSESLLANVSKLQGRPGYRLRVGDYWVIFDDYGAVLDILGIGHLSMIYE